MSFAFLDSTARSTWAAGTSEQGQLEALSALWSGNVEVEIRSSGGTLLTTVLHSGLSINTGTDPRRAYLGAWVSETKAADGTASYAILSLPGSTDILRADVSLAGQILSTNGRTNLADLAPGGLVIVATASLPATDVPAWVPSSNTVADLASESLNTAIGRSVAFWTANGGIGWAPWWGTHGSVITAGGGHGDGSENDAYRFDVGTQAWSQIKPAATVYVKPSGANATYVADETTGLMWDNAVAGDTTTQTGEPFAPHAGGQIVAVPESGVPGLGATNGWLFWAGLYAMPESGQRASRVTHKIRMGVDTTYTIHSSTSIGLEATYVPIVNSCYDPTRRRLWGHLNFTGSGGAVSRRLLYRDLDTEAVSSQDFTSGTEYQGSLSETPFYSAANDCIVSVFRDDADQTTVGLAVFDMDSGVMYRPTLSGTGPVIDERHAKHWCEEWGCVAVIAASNTGRIWFLTPGANIRTDSWTWSHQDLGGDALHFPAGGSIATGLNRLVPIPTAGDGVFAWFGKENEPVQVINATLP